VRRLPDDRYEVLAGESATARRLRPDLSGCRDRVRDRRRAATNLAVLDNLHRADLNPIEETEDILLLVQSSLGVDREGCVAKSVRWPNVAKGRPQEGITDKN
jgi:ParB-like chromosome segregation protein Spo0J